MSLNVIGGLHFVKSWTIQTKVYKRCSMSIRTSRRSKLRQRVPLCQSQSGFNLAT